jgi:hypothetical protein
VKASGQRRVSKQSGGLFDRRWRKHGGTKRRVWRKIHIGIDEQTLEIRAAEFTTSEIGDAPMLPELLDQVPPDQEIASVTNDGAFDTRKCHDAIAARSAAAIIRPAGTPNHGNLTQPGPLGIVLGPMADNASTRNEILRTSKRVGRTIWRRRSGYHRRSRAETKMHYGKLLGQRLSARDFDRQVAEFQVRVIRHCRLDQWRDMAHCSTASQRAARLSRKSQDKSVRGKGNRGHQQICATESPQRQR